MATGTNLMARREFTRDVYAAIMKRAEVPTGWRCEKCGLIVASGHVDHVKPDGLEIDKTRKLTADEGQFLCLPCHKEKTADDVAVIAKCKRVESRHLGIPKQKSKIPQRPNAPRSSDKTQRLREMREQRFMEMNDGQ